MECARRDFSKLLMNTGALYVGKILLKTAEAASDEAINVIKRGGYDAFMECWQEYVTLDKASNALLTLPG